MVGRKGAGVPDVRRVGFTGEGKPFARLDHNPGAQMHGVSNELFHGRDDGRQVRGAEGFAADLAVYGTAVARVDEDGTMTHVPLKDAQS